jgi:glycosyltransferase involved in cell wall biosynthesis
MLAFASVVADPAKFAQCALPGLQRVLEPDSVLAESTDARSMCSAYNEVLDAFAGRDDLEALVLLHEDLEIRDPDFAAKVRARLAADPDVAVLGVVGARDVKTLQWWRGEGVGRVEETRGAIDFGGGHHDADAVDGMLLVLSPWAVRELRFDEASYDHFHGYDADLCFQARAAGRRVVVEDLDVFHHTKGGVGDEAAFRRAEATFARKWFGDAAVQVEPPLVSVLIPTYNRRAYAEQALRCALGQTYERTEILVADNASTDGTVEALTALAGDDERVRIIARPVNVDFFPSSIGLLAEARGEFVKFLLDDDLLVPDAIERLLLPMVVDPTVALSTSKRTPIDSEGVRLPDQEHLKALAAGDVVIPGPLLADHILTTTTNWIGEMSTALFRRDAVAPDELWTLQGREVLANGDLALWLRLLARGGCAYTPAELSSFRIHEAQGGRQGFVQVRGITDWPFLIDGGRALGFLADPAHERRAWAGVLGHLSRVLLLAEDTEQRGLVLGSLQLVHARLAEMDALDGAAASDERIDLRLGAVAV